MDGCRSRRWSLRRPAKRILIDLFTGLDKAGKLPVETKEYLDKAWLEIKETECYQDYGLPRKGI